MRECQQTILRRDYEGRRNKANSDATRRVKKERKEAGEGARKCRFRSEKRKRFTGLRPVRSFTGMCKARRRARKQREEDEREKERG